MASSQLLRPVDTASMAETSDVRPGDGGNAADGRAGVRGDEQLPGFRLPNDAVDVDTVRADADRADGLAHLKAPCASVQPMGIAHAVAVGRRVYPLAAGGAVELAREDSGRSLFPRDAVRAGQFALQAGAGDERQGGLRFCGLRLRRRRRGRWRGSIRPLPGSTRGRRRLRRRRCTRGKRSGPWPAPRAACAALRRSCSCSWTRRGTTCPCRWKSTPPVPAGRRRGALPPRHRDRKRCSGQGSTPAVRLRRRAVLPRPRMAAPSWGGALRKASSAQARRRQTLLL